MYYRRKIILALLQIFEGNLDKIRLQKLLFLFSQRQVKPEYDFIPYKYGCFSYSLNADLTAMVGKGNLVDNETFFLLSDSVNYFHVLKNTDKVLLLEIKKLYGNMSSNSLMKHTYINFPFHAINSLKASELLNIDEFQKVQNAKPKNNDTTLFTIGYEGISLEEYLNRLLKNDIKVLIDVRNNPLSMKFGFSKSQLKRYTESIGIKYMHFPEVGIQSEYRQELKTQADYDSLFVTYKSNLSRTISTQQNIFDILKENKRIALTCFEANICQCHRKHLSESIQKLEGFEYEIKHI